MGLKINLQKQYDGNFTYIISQLAFYQRFPDVTRNMMYAFLESFENAISEPRKILDPNCGFGLDLERLTQRGWEAFGNDVSEQMYELSKTKSDLSLSDFKDLPYEDGFFDAIFSRYGLDYTDDLTKTMREWSRVINSNGAIFLTINNPQIYEEKPLFATVGGINYHMLDLFEKRTSVIKPRYEMKHFTQALQNSGLRCTFMHSGTEHPKKYMSKTPNYIFMVVRKQEVNLRVPMPKEKYVAICKTERWQ